MGIDPVPLESLMKRLFVIFFLFSFSAAAEIRYLNLTFAHLHQNPSRFSQSMSTIMCGHGMRILKKLPPKVSLPEGWLYVKAGPYKGFIKESFLSRRKVRCQQDKYPRFFDQLELSVTDMYYWGRISDQAESGRSKAR